MPVEHELHLPEVDVAAEVGGVVGTDDWAKGRFRSERDVMPRYEFLCEKCRKPFELTMTIAEREKTKPKCPTCKGTNVTPQLGGFMAQTRKKS